MWLLWAFLLNIAITIAVGVLARDKGRSVAGWVIFSLFFGVIALIAIALLRPLYPRDYDRYDPNRSEEEARRQWKDRQW